MGFDARHFFQPEYRYIRMTDRTKGQPDYFNRDIYLGLHCFRVPRYRDILIGEPFWKRNILSVIYDQVQVKETMILYADIGIKLCTS